MLKQRSVALEPRLKDNKAVTATPAGQPLSAPSRTAAKDASPPPAYTASASPRQAEDPPDATAAFANLDLNDPTGPSPTPTPTQCLAHLKLLEALHSLREDISQHDGLFGIKDNFVDASLTVSLAKIREKRWQVYVCKAAKRFEIWWTASVSPNALRQTQSQVSAIGRTPWTGQTLTFAKKHLPPLDVLMVWHAYQLNPRNFLEDCLLFGMMNAWRTGLPWAVINPCINNESFEYDAGADARELFESRTNLCWNSLEDPEMIDVLCPEHKTMQSVPWTQWDNRAAWTKAVNGGYSGEDNTHGFADKEFVIVCRGDNWPYSSHHIAHATLRGAKFRTSFETLKYGDTPMQGTCLGTNGLPDQFGSLPTRLQKLSKQPQYFPNRFLKGQESSSQSVVGGILKDTEVRVSEATDMEAVRDIIEARLKDQSYLLATNGSLPTKEEKIALRRMMSCYWDNASPFSLDLVGAVIRQGAFIEKMHRIDWIHSPAATFTMNRLLTKYDRYLTVVAKAKAARKGQIAVPTLDVDLAWHTHQLCPSMYYQYTVTRLNLFLDHDDKISDTVLSTAFEWTSKTYQKLFNELYSECTCWYCEAIRESHGPRSTGLNPFKRFGGKKPDPLDQQLQNLHSVHDPAVEPNHISAHNAITPAIPATPTSTHSIQERNLKAKLERDYEKACTKARKQGREPPAREDYYYAYAYGYGLYLPMYAPYQPDPCLSGSGSGGGCGGMYVANPACASFVPGAAGNCAAGSCGGGVAAGACGGGGSCAAPDAAGCTAGDSGGGDGGGCGGGCGGCG